MSAAAAIGFLFVVPRALTLPSLAQLNAALKAALSGRHEEGQRLQATYEHAFVGIAEVDLEGRLIRVNKHFCTLTGYDRTELLGRPFQTITHPDDQAVDGQIADRQMRGDLPVWVREKRYVRKDG